MCMMNKEMIRKITMDEQEDNSNYEVNENGMPLEVPSLDMLEGLNKLKEEDKKQKLRRLKKISSLERL